MSSVASTVREELVQQLDDFSAILRRTRDELVRRASAPDSPNTATDLDRDPGQGIGSSQN